MEGVSWLIFLPALLVVYLAGEIFRATVAMAFMVGPWIVLSVLTAPSQGRKYARIAGGNPRTGALAWVMFAVPWLFITKRARGEPTDTWIFKRFIPYVIWVLHIVFFFFFSSLAVEDSLKGAEGTVWKIVLWVLATLCALSLIWDARWWWCPPIKRNLTFGQPGFESREPPRPAPTDGEVMRTWGWLTSWMVIAHVCALVVYRGFYLGD